MSKKIITIDGNEAAAYVAYRVSEVIAIYPITPSSNMGEWSDAWAARNIKNIWGTVPTVAEMQSEAGAAGAVHGALQAGSMSTTFTASQGLLLMIPTMFKVAGELTPTVFHVSARCVATHALSIFGDHSDVMATRSCGWALLASNNPQEVLDTALIAHAATLKTRVPFLHFFDGFRTSHEVSKISMLSDEEIRSVISEKLVDDHRARALDPEKPVLRGTAQNPDVFFQARETCNPFYIATPQIVQDSMDQVAKVTGRQYHLFDYVGAPDADRVIIIMGSGADVAHEAVDYLTGKGEKVGIVKVRLFRPFSVNHFLEALPKTVKSIAVLDRTKEPGAIGEPMYQDVWTSLGEAHADGKLSALPRVIGGRYGLSSKDFTPSQVKAVFDELKKPTPKNHFTVGIIEDVTHTSLDYDANFSTEPDSVRRAVFWGLGADGTVGANKNSIKIIGEETPNFAQGYFVYDSKKSGSVTISHLRFGPNQIRSSYLISQAQFVACHQFPLLERYPVLEVAMDGATFLLNCHYPANEVWDKIPRHVQEQIIAKKLKFYVLDAFTVAKLTKMGARINTIMQTAFFALANILPREEAIEKIRYTIKKTYGARGQAVVDQNFAAVDRALEFLHEVKVPDHATSTIEMKTALPKEAPEWVRDVLGEMTAGRGDFIPASKLPVDGTFPTATTQWEKREVSLLAPVWEEDICIQCGKCILVCPHAVVRAKIVDAADLKKSSHPMKSFKPKFKVEGDKVYTLQVSTADCTGCELCVESCPVKDKTNTSKRAINMKMIEEMTPAEKGDWDHFLKLSDTPAVAEPLPPTNTKNVQLLRPLFEFSGACAGCGETPYVKLMTQLFGDRAVIGNATGCSSIYGGNLPTTPYAVNEFGRGPSWNNSLFEDTAEFGMGMRLALEQKKMRAVHLLAQLGDKVPRDLEEALMSRAYTEKNNFPAKREKLAQLKKLLADDKSPVAQELLTIAEAFIEKSVWIVGGDGWAYDIGYGGLDHVTASGLNVNMLVLDTEVYSNTGGQASKSTARGAVAKFAAGGKPRPKKDLGRISMTYGNVYVASIAFGANDLQTIRAFIEAEAFDGPSIIIAYSHCIAHGIDMAKGLSHQKAAVESGYWPLYRYNPTLKDQGKNPFILESKKPNGTIRDYIYSETRYRMLVQADPTGAEHLAQLLQKDVEERWQEFEKMASAPKGA